MLILFNTGVGIEQDKMAEASRSIDYKGEVTYEWPPLNSTLEPFCEIMPCLK